MLKLVVEIMASSGEASERNEVASGEASERTEVASGESERAEVAKGTASEGLGRQEERREN